MAYIIPQNIIDDLQDIVSEYDERENAKRIQEIARGARMNYEKERDAMLEKVPILRLFNSGNSYIK